MALHRCARAGRDVEHPAETIAVLGSEASGHQVHGFKDLRAYSRAELGLRVVEERDSVDELVQGELVAPHVNEIVVALAGSGHEVGD